jgi:hypothetical protein
VFQPRREPAAVLRREGQVEQAEVVRAVGLQVEDDDAEAGAQQEAMIVDPLRPFVSVAEAEIAGDRAIGMLGDRVDVEERFVSPPRLAGDFRSVGRSSGRKERLFCIRQRRPPFEWRHRRGCEREDAAAGEVAGGEVEERDALPVRGDVREIRLAVKDGAEELRNIQQKSFALAFLDIWMPELTGLEVLARAENEHSPRYSLTYLRRRP